MLIEAACAGAVLYLAASGRAGSLPSAARAVGFYAGRAVGAATRARLAAQRALAAAAAGDPALRASSAALQAKIAELQRVSAAARAQATIPSLAALSAAPPTLSPPMSPASLQKTTVPISHIELVNSMTMMPPAVSAPSPPSQLASSLNGGAGVHPAVNPAQYVVASFFREAEVPDEGRRRTTS